MNFVWKGLSVTLRQKAIYAAWFSSVFPKSYFQCHHHSISYAPNFVHRVTTNYRMIQRAYNYMLRRPTKKFFFTKLSPNVPVFFWGLSSYISTSPQKTQRIESGMACSQSTRIYHRAWRMKMSAVGTCVMLLKEPTLEVISEETCALGNGFVVN
jgi:hypothetical protein